MTPASGDKILQVLGISLFHLADPEAFACEVTTKLQQLDIRRPVPLLASPVGPGFAWDGEVSSGYELPDSALEEFRDPVLARAGDDPDMRGVVGPGEFIMIDRGEAITDDPWALFVVLSERGPCIRWIREGARRLYALSVADQDHPLAWERIDRCQAGIRVKGRVTLLNQEIVQGELALTALPPAA